MVSAPTSPAQITEMERVKNSLFEGGDLNCRDAAHSGRNHRNASAHEFPIFPKLSIVAPSWWAKGRRPLGPSNCSVTFSSHHYFSKNTTAMQCTSILSCSSALRKHKYLSTPPISIAVCLPFVSQYASLLYRVTLRKIPVVEVTGMFPRSIGDRGHWNTPRVLFCPILRLVRNLCVFVLCDLLTFCTKNISTLLQTAKNTHGITFQLKKQNFGFFKLFKEYRYRKLVFSK